MTDTVTLTFTRAEALALDELVNNSAGKFFTVVGGEKDYSFDGWNEKDAANACDKLREAVIGQPSSGSWHECLAMRVK